MRQIGLAVKQYEADNSDTLPSVRGTPLYYGWADAVQPYLNSTQLFQCPSDEVQPGSNAGPTSPGYIDYFYNSHLAGQNESALQYIASTIMLGDAVPGDARQHSNGGPASKSGTARLVNNAGAPVGAATRHLDGANYVFADGHVRWLKGKDANTTPVIRNAASSGSTHTTFGIN